MSKKNGGSILASLRGLFCCCLRDPETPDPRKGGHLDPIVAVPSGVQPDASTPPTSEKPRDSQSSSGTVDAAAQAGVPPDTSTLPTNEKPNDSWSSGSIVSATPRPKETSDVGNHIDMPRRTSDRQSVRDASLSDSQQPAKADGDPASGLSGQMLPRKVTAKEKEKEIEDSAQGEARSPDPEDALTRQTTKRRQPTKQAAKEVENSSQAAYTEDNTPQHTIWRRLPRKKAASLPAYISEDGIEDNSAAHTSESEHGLPKTEDNAPPQTVEQRLPKKTAVEEVEDASQAARITDSLFVLPMTEHDAPRRTVEERLPRKKETEDGSRGAYAPEGAFSETVGDRPQQVTEERLPRKKTLAG